MDQNERLLRENWTLRERCERAERERDTYREAIDRHVAKRVWQTVRGPWQTSETGLSCYDTRAEAEAAYRQQAFPGLDVDTKGTSHG
jgi:hypothetical protein